MQLTKGEQNVDPVLLREAITYFRQEPGLRRMLRLMTERYQSLGRWGGTITLAALRPDEKEALSVLLRKDFSRQQSAAVSLERFAQALGGTRFASLPVLDILSGVFGEPVLTKTEIMKQREKSKQEFFAGLRQKFTPSYCQRWLDAVEAKRPGTRGVHAAYDKDPFLFAKHVERVLTALTELERRNSGWADSSPKDRADVKFERLPLFATRITSDPHGFDPDTEQGRLLVSALDVLRQLESRNGVSPGVPEADTPESGSAPALETALSQAEALTELLYDFGLWRDDLLNFVTCTGIAASDHCGIQLPVWEEANRRQHVLNVPLREIVKIETARSKAGHRVYMVENPGVFSTLLDRCDCENIAYPPLVCAHGQFKLSALLLLDKLVEAGMEVLYAGDFDPEGLQMAERLLKRYPGKVIPWRFTVADYQRAGPCKTFAPRRQKLLEGINSPELAAVKQEILQRGLAAYQEGIVDLLWEDITRKI